MATGRYRISSSCYDVVLGGWGFMLLLLLTLYSSEATKHITTTTTTTISKSTTQHVDDDEEEDDVRFLPHDSLLSLSRRRRLPRRRGVGVGGNRRSGGPIRLDVFRLKMRFHESRRRGGGIPCHGRWDDDGEFVQGGGGGGGIIVVTKTTKKKKGKRRHTRSTLFRGGGRGRVNRGPMRKRRHSKKANVRKNKKTKKDSRPPPRRRPPPRKKKGNKPSMRGDDDDDDDENGDDDDDNDGNQDDDDENGKRIDTQSPVVFSPASLSPQLPPLPLTSLSPLPLPLPSSSPLMMPTPMPMVVPSPSPSSSPEATMPTLIPVAIPSSSPSSSPSSRSPTTNTTPTPTTSTTTTTTTTSTQWTLLGGSEDDGFRRSLSGAVWPSSGILSGQEMAFVVLGGGHTNVTNTNTNNTTMTETETTNTQGKTVVRVAVARSSDTVRVFDTTILSSSSSSVVRTSTPSSSPTPSSSSSSSSSPWIQVGSDIIVSPRNNRGRLKVAWNEDATLLLISDAGPEPGFDDDPFSSSEPQPGGGLRGVFRFTPEGSGSDDNGNDDENNTTATSNTTWTPIPIQLESPLTFGDYIAISGGTLSSSQDGRIREEGRDETFTIAVGRFATGSDDNGGRAYVWRFDAMNGGSPLPNPAVLAFFGSESVLTNGVMLAQKGTIAAVGQLTTVSTTTSSSSSDDDTAVVLSVSVYDLIEESPWWIPRGALQLDDVLLLGNSITSSSSSSSSITTFTSTIYLSMSNDGNRIAIGAREAPPPTDDDDDNNNNNNTTTAPGYAKIFAYADGSSNGGTWTQLGSTLRTTSPYGHAVVSISGDGEVVALGDPFAPDPRDGSIRGNVSIYRYGPQTDDSDDVEDDWNLVGMLPPDALPTIVAGTAVSLSDDGSTVAIVGTNAVTAAINVYQIQQQPQPSSQP